MHSRSLTLAAAALLLLGGIWVFLITGPAPRDSRATASSKPKPEAAQGKTAERDPETDAGALRTIRKALARGAHEDALEGLRGVFLLKEKKAQEMIEWTRENDGAQISQKDPRVAAMLNQMKTLDSRCQDAWQSLLDSDVDQAAVRAVVDGHTKRMSRLGAVLELENEKKKLSRQ